MRKKSLPRYALIILVFLIAWPFGTSRVPAVVSLSPHTAYAVDWDGNLIEFNTHTLDVRVIGPTLPFAELDFRVSDGRLYGVADKETPQLYWISLQTGVSTPVSAPFEQPLPGDVFGFDFNPASDRLRIVSDADANWRIDVGSGRLWQDGRLHYEDGRKANIVAIAHGHNHGPSPREEVVPCYGIDALHDTLVLLDPPGDGMVRTVGPLGVDVGPLTHFDIAGHDTAYLVTVLPGERWSTLFEVNLETGRAEKVGQIQARGPLRAFALELEH
ncbi:MAG TPA: DUF4394 domain-containing protein [Blastocatellia bacterium]|nr:DUF4394 domain-containing protein [Blastocatellia bacterium]